MQQAYNNNETNLLDLCNIIYHHQYLLEAFTTYNLPNMNGWDAADKYTDVFYIQNWQVFYAQLTAFAANHRFPAIRSNAVTQVTFNRAQQLGVFIPNVNNNVNNNFNNLNMNERLNFIRPYFENYAPRNRFYSPYYFDLWGNPVKLPSKKKKSRSKSSKSPDKKKSGGLLKNFISEISEFDKTTRALKRIGNLFKDDGKRSRSRSSSSKKKKSTALTLVCDKNFNCKFK